MTSSTTIAPAVEPPHDPDARPEFSRCAPSTRAWGRFLVATKARSAREECGVVPGTLEPVGESWAMPAVSTERIHLLPAPYRASDRRGPGGGIAHEGEDIAVEVLPIEALADMADRGLSSDMKTVLLVQALRHRRLDLFISCADPPTELRDAQ